MEEWLAHVDVLVPRARRWQTISALLARASRYQVLVLDGSSRRDQIAAALTALMPRRPALVIADSTWKQEAHPLAAIMNRLGIRAIDSRRTTFCVLSRFEEESFARTWGPLKGTVRFTPWPCTLTPAQLSVGGQDSGRVFAGGNSLRDHDAVIQAARLLDDTPVDIATNTLTPTQVGTLPRNVRAASLSRAEFDEAMLNAAVVVAALAPRLDRASGQTTYINAMALGKALVVTDAPGVRDYVEDGRTGLIVPPGDGGAIAGAVRRLLDDPPLRRAVGDQARQHVRENLMLTDYARDLLDVVRETTG